MEDELKELETKISKEKAEKLKNLNESEAAKYMDLLKERKNVARLVSLVCWKADSIIYF